jgi:hypothetical protein
LKKRERFFKHPLVTSIQNRKSLSLFQISSDNQYGERETRF